MKTILKVPVYVEIDSDGNVDRSLVTKAANDIVMPEIMKYLSQGRFKSNVLRAMNIAVGVPVDIHFLSQIDVLQKSLAPRE